MTTQTSNEKKIVSDIIARDFPHLASHEKDIVELVRKTFKYIGRIVWCDGKVLVKNFGTFEYLRRKPRKRHDSGFKSIVTTVPTDKIKFTQSRNIFDYDDSEVFDESLTRTESPNMEEYRKTINQEKDV